MNKTSTATNDDVYIQELREIVENCRAQGFPNEMIRQNLALSAAIMHHVMGEDTLYRVVADLIMLLADAAPVNSHKESAHAE